MEQKAITKEQEHIMNQLRFKKTPEEKLEAKRLKSEWKKTNPKSK